MKNQSVFKLTAFLSLLLGALVFSGCHTMEGAGKDIQKAGDKIEDAPRRQLDRPTTTIKTPRC